ncbi:MAG TPA: hypothetical protein PKX93_01370 [bacterium]|nr:hypothetical protein [bacterium]
MTDREWVLAALAHSLLVSLPYYFDFTPPARAKAERLFGTPLEKMLHYPVVANGVRGQKPLSADPEVYGETVADEFGVL